eukprot:CAMPEP_0185594938 /NCGR_PEP_ID=MMETSP0434-20130131/76679_1 /TAXON_ID=626734 ORGANISM="Favella taraikaensis, Strain Fe Narragansett Bay" /NCGR_SAMPLE_ID=MMETSP0434 /ASSEMBLY_ACC=CAM_ASM_000379 /LENGTH=59 /DNA_ID=CAMNT_0028222597 /DNA_START=41 /DNA_END=217 /DNA_ORIENTATION=+
MNTPETTAHYDRWITANEEGMHPSEKAHYMDGVPHIYGAFTDWRPKKMRDLVEFLMTSD